VERTIELGYPRLDIHTWAGNTKAVPLYKKCGYLWEDRENSTHLVNFIPSIIKAEPFTDFFKKADWYADSTRVIEIKPDGVKVNKFELFGYSWEKDGETLAVGYERSGRRMRFIETNDYKIEFMADNHELAFGLNYNCTFTVENKSGKELNIKINGRNERNITFDYTAETSVTGCEVFTGNFRVAPVNEKQDTWRVHPCVFADVEINGKKVEFGLGINTKTPVQVDVKHRRSVPRIGSEYVCYLNISSSLPHDASVSFAVPENGLLKFGENASFPFTADISANGRASVKTVAAVLGFGHERLMIKYSVTFKNPEIKPIEFEYPMYVTNQSMTHAFSYTDETHHRIINGPWGIRMSKSYNEASTTHINGVFDTHFDNPMFGKPYSEEFNTAKPADVRMFNEDGVMYLESDFISEKFTGFLLTQVFALSASGMVTRSYRVKNIGSNPQSVMLKDTYWMPVEHYTHFHYDGKVVRNSDYAYGFEHVESEKFGENWLFEANPHLYRGICWHPTLKPNFRWGSGLYFEYDTGTIAPNGVYTTHPVEIVYNTFSNFNDFRNYALSAYEKIPPADERIQTRLNGHNPFISSPEVVLEVFNNRSAAMQGTVTVSSALFETQTQTNPAETVIPVNAFALELTKPDNLGVIQIDFGFATFKKTEHLALFRPGGGSVTTVNDNDEYTVGNGLITFKLNPRYADCVYSLISAASGNEWLFSRYPNHEPYGWVNPYIGGIYTQLENMRRSMLVKEPITADLTVVSDDCGNEWRGIRTTLTVEHHDGNRGLAYESYFLTMPNLPVLCHFIKFINNRGIFKEERFGTNVSFYGGGELTDLAAVFGGYYNTRHTLRFGVSHNDCDVERALKIESAVRSEKMYIYKDAYAQVEGDNMTAEYYGEERLYAEHGKTAVSKPTFVILTDIELPLLSLDSLRRIRFDGISG
jgi:hypothetical protein